MLAIVALAAVAYVLWRKKALQRRIKQHQENAKQRQAQQDAKQADTFQLSVQDHAEIAGDEEEQNHFVITGALDDPTLSKRRSFGAATHLSRITEGCEEEEEEYRNGAKRGRHSMLSAKSVPQSVTSAMGPRVSIGSGTTFGSKNIIPIVFRPPPPAVPTAVHRATGAPVVPQMNKGPVRPVRAPDLNLRLPAPTNAPAKSSPLANTSSPSTLDNDYAFMSIDPAQSSSSVDSRHLSTGTIGTMNSYNSTSMSYVLSAPQVITPVSSEGIRRVQVGQGGQAVLVRGNSLKRNNNASKTTDTTLDPFQDPLFTTVDEDGEMTLMPPSTRKLFGRSSQSSAISTSTLGIPFSENPFGPVRTVAEQDLSPSDAVDRSSWLGQAFEAIEALEQTDIISRSKSATPIEDETREELDDDDDDSNPFQDPTAERASTISGSSLLSNFAFLPAPIQS